jgi:hypothetical protein
LVQDSLECGGGSDDIEDELTLIYESGGQTLSLFENSLFRESNSKYMNRDVLCTGSATFHLTETDRSFDDKLTNSINCDVA